MQPCHCQIWKGDCRMLQSLVVYTHVYTPLPRREGIERGGVCGGLGCSAQRWMKAHTWTRLSGVLLGLAYGTVAALLLYVFMVKNPLLTGPPCSPA